MASKVCSKCKVEKSLDNFHRRKSRKDGRTSRCKTCRRQRQRENYARKHGHATVGLERTERIQKSNLYNNGKLTIVSRTHGSHVVLYDMEDETKLKEHTWSLKAHGAGVYYVRTRIPRPNGEWYVGKDGTRRRRRQKDLLLHHLIKEVPKGMCIDHRNGNPLDNRKENLLVTTRKRNNQNYRKYVNNTSGFNGVQPRDSKRLGKRWMACFYIDGKRRSLGTFSTAKEAAEAYDMAVCKYWEVVSPERQLNFPERYDEYMADVKKI